ncbi:MAG: methyltransferase domain-containing protein [Rhizobacter sp.]|nr:methyltransferase domain-containing protein [Bacteriovorax sp.]
MKFSNYQEFKKYIWNNYQPISQELISEDYNYKSGTNWAKLSAPRFFRALQTISSVSNAKSFIDVGTYPGSFSRLIKLCLGDSETKIYACGMVKDNEFEENLAKENLIFFNCNLDPDIKTPIDVHEGIPLSDNSVDCIVLMEVIEHLYSLKTIMLEAFRVLKPNGICYVTTNNISDRLGLLRIICNNSTNLDEDIIQTSIWSDYQNTWRGHVRFYSLKQLSDVGVMAGFKIEKQDYFQNYEDPDIHNKKNSMFNFLRNILNGDGSRPPIRLKIYFKSIWYLGIKSLSKSYDSHLEIVYRKPFDQL